MKKAVRVTLEIVGWLILLGLSYALIAFLMVM